MTPTRQTPNNAQCSSERDQLPKGDLPMGKINLVAAAMVLLTASWVCAGNFEVLADAGIIKAPTPLYIKPGTVVKAEFKSNLRTTSDVEMDAESLFPERVSAKAEPKVQPRPAVAFKERKTRAMAPPPPVNNGVSAGSRNLAAAEDEVSNLESDLEKDLVLSPPPAKGEESGTMETKPATEAKPTPREKSVVTDKKPKAAPSVKRKSPSDYERYAGASKPIQKVRPLTTTTRNPWSYPAGSYGNRSHNVSAQRFQNPPARPANQGYRPMEPQYMSSEPRRIAPPPTTERFVRDGVTVRLAPAAAPASYPYPMEEENDSDILSTAAEIIGMPFAFISSFF